ncbi:calcium-binding protein [Sphingomonas sinipercae]|uniref:Calcium-binding protein n=1 Tax=Sphingomonas sinipercae TaxID=2714944 RepID=A0A6G7ZL37_9SPHN|nr:EF-hand domain-containing protein [Sphingomonas sinipercae]QIL01642.1 calcium-binding protein [Sphingomonas sinipercae]
MRTQLLAAVAALGLAAFAPAIAQQPAPQAPHHQMMMKEMNRAQLLQQVQQHFARADQNRDGFVTQAELASLRAMNKDRRQDKIAQVRGKRFDRLDANKDGAISRVEFDSAHQAHAGQGKMAMRGHMGGRMHMAALGGRMFQMADSNRDGRVSLQEATGAAAAHFDAADTNRDGRLTGDEMRAAHQRMGGRPRG